MKKLLFAFLLISSSCLAFEPVKNASAAHCVGVSSEVIPSGQEKKIPLPTVQVATAGNYFIQIKVMNPQINVPDLPIKLVAKVNGEVVMEFPTSITTDETKVQFLEFAKALAVGDIIELFVTHSLGHPVTVAAWYQVIPVPAGEQ
jgi:hypothetical protein